MIATAPACRWASRARRGPAASISRAAERREAASAACRVGPGDNWLPLDRHHATFAISMSLAPQRPERADPPATTQRRAPTGHAQKQSLLRHNLTALNISR